MSYQTLLIRKEGPVDWVTMNRPDSLNALNRQLIEYLLDYTNRQQTAEFLRDFNAAMREHASRQK